MKTEVDDNYIMPFGVYKGKKIANCPADYLLWLYDNDKVNQEVKQYIEENKQELEKEAQLNNEKNGK